MRIVQIEFGLDWITLILSLAVFIVFAICINRLVRGESKTIFTWLTVFLGLYFLGMLSVEGLEIAHFLKIHKTPLTKELEETAALINHILQVIGLAILVYVSVLFRSFAKRIEMVKV